MSMEGFKKMRTSEARLYSFILRREHEIEQLTPRILNWGAVVDLKKAVEKHPLTYILSCIVAAVIVTAGVMGYFAEQHTKLLNTKHQSEVDELNSKLASIRRGIPGDEFFDVRKLIYSPNSDSNMPPKSSVYFPEGFYATTSHGVWSYRQTTEWALICDIAGCSPKDVPKHIREAGTLGKVHLWKTGNELSIEGHDLYKKAIHLFASKN